MTEPYFTNDLASSGEDQFLHLIEHIAVGVVKHRPDLSIVLANSKALELLGLTKDQLVGKTSFDPSWHVINEQGQTIPADLHPVSIALKTAKPLENMVMGVFRPLRNDRVWISATAIPELDETGKVQFITVTFSEVDAIKKNELKIVESNKLIKTILDASYDAIIVYNKSLEKIFISQSVSDISGYSLEELYSSKSFSLVAETDKHLLNQIIEELKSKGSFKDKKLILKTKQNQYLDFIWSGKWDQELGLAYLIGKNITEQKTYESELMQSKRLFKFSSEINDLILNAKSPLDLYEGFCEIAVKTGGFLFAFVGLRDDKKETIVPFRHAGAESGYLDYFKKHISIKN